MSKTHWKKLTNPDYLGAYALDPGKDLVATIQYVCEEKVVGSDGKKEDCTVVHFQESIKPLILNVTNAKTIEKVYGTPFIEDWAGKKIQIYSAKVKAFGEVVEALRIRQLVPKERSHPSAPPKCGKCGSEIKAFDESRDAAFMAAYTAKKYGQPLCSDCAKKESQGELEHADK
ncbi:MAG: hypothetical protein LKJ74_05235 [Clostridiales bacterium]|jgi:hypothetical protein|nr:hypothetical protein [Clostridiales bacterium]MCI2161736.1 hypothetical protein [Oscillospiraceae bacterium]MCI2191702.1 hypothetical protein [Oscillospiraceae bacterium]MCI2205669.1 hypothetical protein [Oscillospiraceae bacterium]